MDRIGHRLWAGGLVDGWVCGTGQLDNQNDDCPQSNFVLNQLLIGRGGAICSTDFDNTMLLLTDSFVLSYYKLISAAVLVATESYFVVCCFAEIIRNFFDWLMRMSDCSIDIHVHISKTVCKISSAYLLFCRVTYVSLCWCPSHFVTESIVVAAAAGVLANSYWRGSCTTWRPCSMAL